MGERKALRRAPRFCFVIDGRDEAYGVREAIVTLLAGLRSRGWEVRLASLVDGPFAAECARASMPVKNLDIGQAPTLKGPLSRKILNFVRQRRHASLGSRRLLAALGDLRPDLIHVNWPNHLRLAGMAARRLRVPCIWQMHGAVSDAYAFDLNKRIFQRICQAYHIIPLANSQATAESLVCGSGGIRPGCSIWG